jgi:hypothetical protein
VETQTCTIDIWPELFGLPTGAPMVMHDLMHGRTETFALNVNRLTLNPNHMPFAIWRAERSPTS